MVPRPANLHELSLCHFAEECEIDLRIMPLSQPMNKNGFIQFSPHAELYEKIHKAVQKTGIKMLYDTQRNAIRYYQIPVKNAKKFLKAIQALQKEQIRIDIPTSMLEEVLATLQKEKILKTKTVEKFKKSISTTETTYLDYSRQAQESKSVEKTISLSHYFLTNQKQDRAIEWLCKAKEYANNRPLSEWLDLKIFFGSISEITTDLLFCPECDELILAAAQSTKLEKISLPPFTNYTLSKAECIAKLIEKTKSVSSINLGSISSVFDSIKLSDATIKPIADALKKNASIEEISLGGTRLGDAGVILLIERLKKKSRSRVNKLVISNCGMGDLGANKIKEWLSSYNGSLEVDYSSNNGITLKTKDEINTILLNKRKR